MSKKSSICGKRRQVLSASSLNKPLTATTAIGALWGKGGGAREAEARAGEGGGASIVGKTGKEKGKKRRRRRRNKFRSTHCFISIIVATVVPSLAPTFDVPYCHLNMCKYSTDRLFHPPKELAATAATTTTVATLSTAATTSAELTVAVKVAAVRAATTVKAAKVAAATVVAVVAVFIARVERVATPAAGETSSC